MIYIAHRVNTVSQLGTIPTEFGAEVDLRDYGDRLVLQHDPFVGGEPFEQYLQHYRHGTLILNVKSERVEPRVLELVHRAGVTDYFFLDCSFPMIQWLIRHGERRIAVRFSEYELAESALTLAGKVAWVWVDCFTKMPLEPDTYRRLKQHFRLCIVSPELQGRPVETITQYAHELKPYPFDAVCSKRLDLWQAALGDSLPAVPRVSEGY